MSVCDTVFCDNNTSDNNTSDTNISDTRLNLCINNYNKVTDNRNDERGDEKTTFTIIADIERGLMSSHEIMEKYNLTKYKYYKILKEFCIKNPCMKTGPKGPTSDNSTFKELMILPPKNIKMPDEFDKDLFVKDFETGYKIIDLIKKYNLTLEQFKELRKKYLSK